MAGQYEVLMCWTVLDGTVTIPRSDSTEVCNALTFNYSTDGESANRTGAESRNY